MFPMASSAAAASSSEGGDPVLPLPAYPRGIWTPSSQWERRGLRCARLNSAQLEAAVAKRAALKGGGPYHLGACGGVPASSGTSRGVERRAHRP